MKAKLDQYIEEIPPLRPEVTRLTTWSGACACCGEVFSTHPLQTSRAQGAASVQLGPRALALGAMLNKQLGITMRGTCRVLRQVCGLSITPGGLAQGLARVAGKLACEYQALLQGLRDSPAVFTDETSWWVGGPGWWLWMFTTPGATVYRVDESRGSQVVKQTLGEDFAGMLVSDCLSSYEPAAEPTNNRAERELRPAVIARKLSCGNKTPAGRTCCEVLASIARTCSQRAEDFVDFLAARLPLSPLAG